MFIGREILERLLGAYESKSNDVKAILDTHLASLIEAKDAQLKSVIAAKDAELDFMRRHIEDLRTTLAEERKRTQGAIDRLLVRDAQVHPLMPMVASPASVAVGAADSRAEVLRKIFAVTGQVGEDDESETPDKLEKTTLGIESDPVGA